MAKFIVAIETVKIKEFLFSTNKLKVIRGASYLLDYLNQVEVPKILKKDKRVEDKDIIYVGAGNAKFFVERETKEEAEKVVKEIIAEVKEKYEREAPGAKVVGVYVETQYKKGEKSENGKEVWNDLDKLGELTAIEKSKGFSTLNIDLPRVEKCELSGTELAEISIKNFSRDLENLGFHIKDGELIFKELSDTESCSINLHTLKGQINNQAKTTGKISDASFRKILFANLLKKVDKIDNVGFYNTIKEYIRNDENVTKENTTNDIEVDIKTNIQDYQDTDSFFGLMYSDGDGLGDFLKGSKDKFIKLLEEKDNAEDLYLKFMGEFSKELDRTTKESLRDVLKEVFEKADKRDKWGEFLIVGGDDVCAVFPPNLVMEISMKFQKRFEEQMAIAMKEITKDIGEDENTRITSSSGVIIAKAKTPMFQLFEQALHLQKSAKKARKKAVDKNLNKTGFIDFQVIGSEGCVDIDEFRDKFKDNKVMERPYSIALEKEDDFTNIEKLLTLIKDMKKITFPSNKLRYIYDLKADKKKANFEKKMELINILSKMNKEQVKFIKDRLGIEYKSESNEKLENDFTNDFVNIFDILEIYNFID
ncbi:Cas10/Cmr2 second palm domain-containing protein [Fusobacterium polymorphum]|uniref:Cas10/Cmr2 second palm domain-containing protein n=1 Tax=Fusobacterium nucleatum subsp. polymorphum TaxID=76857 RepID=UPI0030CFF972